ncbi:hypothetical protein Ga0609869_002590 [Rhodovulum iodosum]|uniref:Uncharacterized protein n=1 Tax=Rhodovulum iodosum TaxID=68291 RepID=A0ABV3XY32_9RHOB|nr:hypothetical protein [Rhodovulum robiginosum]RSK33579.1 hypothetical protein EJA01_09835 [Rhodovulum robiginosum]
MDAAALMQAKGRAPEPQRWYGALRETIGGHWDAVPCRVRFCGGFWGPAALPASDTPRETLIDLHGMAKDWFAVTIVGVQAGRRYADTCVNAAVPDLDYDGFLMQQRQGGQPGPAPAAPPADPAPAAPETLKDLPDLPYLPES